MGCTQLRRSEQGSRSVAVRSLQIRSATTHHGSNINHQKHILEAYGSATRGGRFCKASDCKGNKYQFTVTLLYGSNYLCVKLNSMRI